MNGFIAFCENPSCGAVFEGGQNLFGGSGLANIKMTNTRVGPCPSCGKYGVIPDGVYSYANNAISFLTGPATSVTALTAVKKLLQSLMENPKDREAVLKEVETVSPEAANVFKNSPQIENYSHWVMMLIALIALAIQVHTTYFKEEKKDYTDQFIEHLINENKALKSENKQINAHKKQPYKREKPKVQRNDMSPCGSGGKFKKCCGLTIQI